MMSLETFIVISLDDRLIWALQKKKKGSNNKYYNSWLLVYQTELNVLYKWSLSTLKKISLLINYNYTHFIVKYTETYTNVIIAIHCNVGKWESNSGTKTFLMVNSRLTDIPQ